MNKSLPIVCTLCEGNYLRGAGALLNSLHSGGFEGTVWVGYKGELPAWFNLDQWRKRLGDKIQLELHLFEGKRHFAHRKAEFMQLILAMENRIPRSIFYFDPDIVSKCDWSLYERWASCGIAAIEDVNSPRNRFDPRRFEWRELAASAALPWHRDMDLYVNSGFLGLASEFFEFLQTWQKAIERVFELVPETAGIQFDVEPNFAYKIPDQDAFNIALCSTPLPVSIMGKEAMDFAPGGAVMSHAIGSSKPWSRSYLRDSLDGIAPRSADKLFLQHSMYPIQLYSPITYKWRLFGLRVALLLGRFYKRN